MTTSYDSRRDVLNFVCAEGRAHNPARYAIAVTPSNSAELVVYGRLIVTNAHATAAETITVIMAENNVDDTTTVAFNIAPQTTLYLPVVVRRVMATGTGADITATLIA